MDPYIVFACSLLLLGITLIVRHFQKVTHFKQRILKEHKLKKSELFTKKEAEFYSMLCHACNGKAIVFGKVSVTDIITVQKKLSINIRNSHNHKVYGTIFDYVICNNKDLSIIAVVSLKNAQEKNKKIINKSNKENAKHRVAFDNAQILFHCYDISYSDFSSVRKNIFIK